MPTSKDQMSPSEQHNCQMCTEPDAHDNMVQCDKCDLWFHYQCAQVDSFVAYQDWTCQKCAPPIPAPVVEHAGPRSTTSSKPSKTSRSSSAKHLQLQLQRLEEERSLKEKRDQEYLDKKYCLLSQAEDSSESDDEAHSLNSPKQVQEWLQNARNSTVSIRNPVKFAGNSKIVAPELSVPYVHQPIASSSWMGAVVAQQQRQQHQSQLPANPNEIPEPLTAPITVPSAKSSQINRLSPRQRSVTKPQPSQTQCLPSVIEMQIPPQQPQCPPNIQLCDPDEIPPLSISRRSSSSHDHGHTLTRSNLAARHSISKDLHSFGGSPEDWPLFISNFNRSTELCGFSEEENLVRLQRALKGKALEAVRCMLIQPECVPRIISTLKMLFGRPELIIHSILQRIHTTPPPKAEKLETIVGFAVVVQNMCATMEASGMATHLNNPTLLQELVAKLPPSIRLNWAIFRQTLPVCTISHFSTWLYQIAEAANYVIVPNEHRPETKQPIRSDKDRGFLNAHAEVCSHGDTSCTDMKERRCPICAGTCFSVANRRKFETKQPIRSDKDRGFLNAHAEVCSHGDTSCTDMKERRCPICAGTCFSVANCRKFEQLSHSLKWAAVREHKLCRKCLTRHMSNKCKSDVVCGKNNCSFKHHRLLHNDQRDIDRQPLKGVSMTASHNAHSREFQSMLFRVVPVVLYGNGIQLLEFAFLDDGSSLTLLEEQLAKDLNVEGTPEPLCLRWAASTHRYESDSKVMSIRISGTGKNNKKYPLANIHTVKSLQLPRQSVDAKKLQEEFRHLRGLPIESYEDAAPRLLIGLNNWRLGLPINYREGKAEEPVATKTRLGWTIHGHCSHSPPDNGCINTQANFHTCGCNNGDDIELQRLVKEFISSEQFGASKSEHNLLSAEEKRAQELLQGLTRRKNGRFETGLLWKYENISLPDSLPMAKRRLIGLQKQMNRNPQTADALHEKLEEYISKGYARKLSPKEIKENRQAWYLPVFPVINPNKPGKLRIVWDAAAKVQGVSLNSVLLKGPDQLASLTSVIYRFREKHIAICGDIMEMFHQIQIREEDQHYQRFLWVGRNQKEIDFYVLKVMSFGATCSPCCAQYVKNRNADEFQQEYPRAVKSIRENHYVDDLMDSVDSEEEAIELANQIRYIHLQGGFYIRNWISNSQTVLSALQSNPREEIKFSSKSELGTEKVLGMWWCTTSDSFTYKLSPSIKSAAVLSGNDRPTKREVLRILMTIFDPLGLLANFLMYIKVLLQEIWRSGVAWDEKIQDPQYDKWLNWIRFLPAVVNLQIPRCYITNRLIRQPERHLHVFVDASENGFAAAAYIRSRDGELVECALVGAKTRVAPLRSLSVPRLELQAAVLGARLAKSIVDSHSIKFQKQVFWTDSKTVFSWLRSDHRRYRQFVAFRVSEILDTTNLADWHWIPSELNVADEATKWKKNPDFSASNRWFRGPSFLTLPPESWPSTKQPETATSEEIRSQFIAVHCVHHIRVLQPERFSNWNRLVRSTSYVLRFLHNLQSRRKKTDRKYGKFSQAELEAAEMILFREAQRERFPKETASISAKQCIHRSSPLVSLCPHLDENGVLRASGRLDHCQEANVELKRPVILPKDHAITNLLVQDYHRRYHHQNHETVINEIRQRYRIPRLRVVLRTVRRSCQLCKIRTARPQPPLMGQLPVARLASFTRPFSYVGIDYFGPIYISNLRRREKRWGVLLTCLTTRAVHIEIAHTLSTDSCILAIRNFIARRGSPIEFYSDNGTNFKGAERELKEAYQNVDKQRLMEIFTTANMKWSFIPPASPHMGGCWERLVRSIKTALYKIMPNRYPSDELLRSMLMEVESTVNSRPLTYVPLDDENKKALTPNHFLLGSSSGSKPIAILNDDKATLKKNWLISQLYAESFWKRWVKEYLPTITRRTKWFAPVKPIEVGDIVLVVDPNSPRNCWPKGRVIETRISKDGQVRRAAVLTQAGILERPAVKLAVLDIGDSATVEPLVAKSPCL